MKVLDVADFLLFHGRQETRCVGQGKVAGPGTRALHAPLDPAVRTACRFGLKTAKRKRCAHETGMSAIDGSAGHMFKNRQILPVNLNLMREIYDAKMNVKNYVLSLTTDQIL